jgi:hypothetical protein
MVDDNEFVKRRHLSRGRPRKYDPGSPSADAEHDGTNGNSSVNSEASNGTQSTINRTDLRVGPSTATVPVSSGYDLETISPAFNTFSSSFNSLLNINTASNHQQSIVGQQSQTNYFSSTNTFETQ